MEELECEGLRRNEWKSLIYELPQRMRLILSCSYIAFFPRRKFFENPVKKSFKLLYIKHILMRLDENSNRNFYKKADLTIKIRTKKYINRIFWKKVYQFLKIMRFLYLSIKIKLAELFCMPIGRGSRLLQSHDSNLS